MLAAGGGLAVQAAITTGELTASGGGPLSGLWRLAAFFSNWSNGALAVVALAMLVGARRGLGGPRARLAVLPSIVVVALAYTLLLRAEMVPAPPLQTAVRSLLHDVTPVLFALVFVLSPHGALKWRDSLWALALPAPYAAFSLARSVAQGWSPYWFLDVQALAPAALARNAALFLAAFVALGLLVVALDKSLHRVARLRAGAGSAASAPT